MRTDIWECECCNWIGEEQEIRKVRVHDETILEPAEWLWHCPDCNRTEGLEQSFPVVCRTCEEEPVQHEGDQCTECYTEECERYVDASRGH